MTTINMYMYTYIHITKKNFGLIHVYFLYTVFRVTHVLCTHQQGYMTTKLFEKNCGGGFLVVFVYSWYLILRYQREKNHQCLRSTLSRWWRHLATISFRLFSVVLGSAREMCVFSIRQRLQILTLLLYDGARLRMDQ